MGCDITKLHGDARAAGRPTGMRRRALSVMRTRWVGLVVMGMLPWTLMAAPVMPAPVAPARPVDLAAVQVRGEQPGPGLWKISNAQGHTLWLLGTVSPLPEGIEWTSTEVMAVIAAADHLLMPPGPRLKQEIGVLRGLTLLPAALRAKRDPQGRTLAQALPPQTFARWQALKAQYIGRDRGLEQDRPIVAAAALYGAFLERNALVTDRDVQRTLQRAYKARGLAPEDARVVVDVPDVRAVLKDLRTTAVDDTACLQETLDIVETELPLLRERANAWALGDVAALRRLARAGRRACTVALEDSAFARRHGFNDLPQRARQHWVDRAAAALDTHASTFAAVPLRLLLGEEAYLEAFRQRGYTVHAPPE